MSDKSPTKHIEIVKSVLYAVVVSAWASLVCNHSQGVAHFWGQIKLSIDSLLSLCKYGRALMSIGTFVFFTIYFHDEWKYCNHSDYPKENPASLCVGWTLFLFQVCLIGASLVASSLVGILGTIVVTFGLFRANREAQPKAKVKYFIAENILWIAALVVCAIARHYNWSEYLNFVLLLPLAFPLVRKISWVKQFLPQ